MSMYSILYLFYIFIRASGTLVSFFLDPLYVCNSNSISLREPPNSINKVVYLSIDLFCRANIMDRSV